MNPYDRTRFGEDIAVTDLVGAEAAASAPTDSGGALWLRDRLRHLLGGLDIESRVQLSPYGVTRRMTIDPLSLDESRTLIRTLSANAQTPAFLAKGAVVWCDERQVVGEVHVPGTRSVLLRAVPTGGEWWSDPLKLRPPTLAEINTVLTSPPARPARLVADEVRR